MILESGTRMLAVLPFGPLFPDFGPDPDYFEEISPEMVRIWLKIEETDDENRPFWTCI